MIDQNGHHRLARASQAMIKYALNAPLEREFAFRVGCTGLCQFRSEDWSVSLELLRRSISNDLPSEVQVKNLYVISSNIGKLIESQADFVQEIYLLVQSLRFSRDVETQIGNGVLLQLSSNLRQDHESVLYQLAKTFPTFLKANPALALACLNDAIEQRHNRNYYTTGAEVRFRNKKIPFAADGSYYWDDRHANQHEHQNELLKCLSDRLGAVSSNSSDQTEMVVLLDAIAGSSPSSVVFRRLLRAGTSHPRTLGISIAELAMNDAILTCPDTRIEAAKFLSAAFHTFPTADRVRIESAILAIPTIIRGAGESNRDLMRDRLLVHIRPEDLQSIEAKEAYTEAISSTVEPEEEASITFGGVPSEEIDAMILEQRGVKREIPNEVQQPLKLLRAFARDYLNAAPAPSKATQALVLVEDLDGAIARHFAGEELKRWQEIALGIKASVASAILHLDATATDAELLRTLTEILVEAATGEYPKFSKQSNDQFDRSPSWGSEQPRSEAAIGIMRILRIPNSYTPEIQEAICSLSQDPCHGVRALVIEELNLLENHDPQLYRDTVSRVSRFDESYAVCRRLVTDVLRPRLGLSDAELMQIAEQVYARFPDADDRKSVREACLSLFVEAFVHGNSEAERLIRKIVEDVETNGSECRQLVANLLFRLRNYTEIGCEKRHRIWKLTASIVTTVFEKWDVLRVKYHDTPTKSIPTDALATYKSLGHILVEAMDRVYYASGATNHLEFSTEQIGKSDSGDKELFWTEAQGLLDALQGVGIPNLVHHAVETLGYFIEVHPSAVFRRLAAFTIAGSSFGYHNDSLACDTILKIVERYLAEHRDVFKRDAECQRLLLELLGLFLGWPKAKKLAYRLDEIYR